ncbi:MAG: trehalose-phosphatase [Candidatus Susulua stagnicola]|nr:trehalose-phosphatase [Candidatus Susulua stagnicola]
MSNKYSFKSVIFDLDGVITKTALVHAAAWKEAFDEYLRLRDKRDKEPFKEFTHQSDYLPYVDGKPRYKGVQSFLESRGINISYGEPTDSPDTETICGIGNKKNAKFCQVLRVKGVEVYPSTIEFIKSLEASGVEIGVASSSNNCKEILEVAKIEKFFKTRVDGVVSIEMGLKGKPESDIFTTAAFNLGTIPAESIVVEDATSGVEAGRNGGFGLVIGLARENNQKELLANGADLVVTDLAEINLELIEQWFRKKPRDLLQSWDKESEKIESLEGKEKDTEAVVNPSYLHSGKSHFFSGKKIVFFLDYDGTLTPIVSRPELAVISSDMQDTVKKLSQKYITAIVSGRMREDVEKLVGISGLIYAGSHGFDIKGPEVVMVESQAEKSIPLVSKVIEKLKKELVGIEGVIIEEKKFSTAVHYRLVKEAEKNLKIRNLVREIIQENKTLRLMEGKKVFEILPAIDWNKGKAVRWVMDSLGINWQDYSVVYIGDDTTDEDAFRTVCTRGTSILVSDKDKFSAADFMVSSPKEVKELFERILAIT